MKPVFGIISAAVLAVAAGSYHSAVAQTPKRGGVLIQAIEGEPPNLDLHQSASAFVLALARPMYSNLVRYDQNNYPQIIGDLAESWTVAPDGLSYTFKLRSNVKFHDGSAFSAADIKASFDRIRNPPQGVPSIRRSDFADVSAIDTPDAQTVVFRLSTPNVALLSLIASPFNVIYSARKLQENPAYPATTPMGTGGFVFGEYQKGSVASGTRFDGYFRAGLPYLDGFRTQVMSAGAPINSIVAGQIDAVFRTTLPPEIQTMRNGLGDRVVLNSQVSGTSLQLAINTKRKPYDDVRVRRALMLAIDTKTGVENMSKITPVIAHGGPMRPGSDFSLSPEEIAKYTGYGRDMNASRAEARRLMAEAGQSGLKIKLLNRNIPAYTPHGIFVLDQFRAAGFDAEQEVLESQIVISRTTAGDFDLTIDTNLTPSDDPSVVLTKYLPGSASNYGGFVDPMLTELYDKQKAALDVAKRRELVNTFERRVLDQAYYAPMFWLSTTPAFRSYVKGWKGTSTTVMGYDLVEVWKDQ